MTIKILMMLGVVHAIYGQEFNSNPRQQDHSGGLNLQIDTSSTSTQYIGPRPSGSVAPVPLSYNPYGSSGRSGFNSNPRQQDLSGSSSNIQIDKSSSGRQYIGPSQGNSYSPTSGRPQYGNSFNSNSRQHDLSGGRNVQIDTSENSKQYIGPGVMRQGFDGFADSDSEEGVEYPNYGKAPRVKVNGRDYTGKNVQEPGLHINQSPY